MQKIMFNDRYGLTDAVLDGRKTMTRRIATKVLVENENCELCWNGKFQPSRYFVGKVVAVAQNYKDVREGGYPVDSRYDAFREADWGIGVNGALKASAGETNKMFVKAELMPHRIRITDIRVERLQDISDEDCLREGVVASNCKTYFNGYAYDWVCDQYGDILATQWFKTPREAFAALIDKVSGKGTWESNPYVWVYSFQLIK